MDLHHLVDHVGEHLAAEHLRDGALDRVLLDAPLVRLVVAGGVLRDRREPVVDEPGEPVDERLGREDVRRRMSAIFSWIAPKRAMGDAELLAQRSAYADALAERVLRRAGAPPRRA